MVAAGLTFDILPYLECSILTLSMQCACRHTGVCQFSNVSQFGPLFKGRYSQKSKSRPIIRHADEFWVSRQGLLVNGAGTVGTAGTPGVWNCILDDCGLGPIRQ